MGAKQKYVAHYLFWCAATVACVLCATGLVIAIKWPFRQKEIVEDLERLSKCHVRIVRFQDFRFPKPGYVAKESRSRVRLRRARCRWPL